MDVSGALNVAGDWARRGRRGFRESCRHQDGVRLRVQWELEGVLALETPLGLAVRVREGPLITSSKKCSSVFQEVQW